MPKAKRNNQGKLRIDLLPPEWEIELAKVMHQGAYKYAPNNWLKGMPYSACWASSRRHQAKYRAGEKIDSETGCYHLAQAAWNLLAILSYELRDIGEDDLQVTQVKDPKNILNIPEYKGNKKGRNR